MRSHVRLKYYLDILILPAVLLVVLFGGVHFRPLKNFFALFKLEGPLFIIICGTLAYASVVFRVRPVFLLQKAAQRKKEIFLALASFLFALVLGDLVLGQVLPPVHKATKYGWTVKANVKEKYIVEDTPGHFRNITVEFFRDGFKRWGNLAATGQKVLILGDSFTHMIWVPNGEEWYAYLEEAFPDVEFFVYGGGGYGPLQEFMVLDDHFDEIQPDLVLWQFCSNDYANSFYELDLSTYPYNNHAVRPYLENGDIVYRLPLPLASLREYSFIADHLLHLYDQQIRKKPKKNLKAYKEKRYYFSILKWEITQPVVLNTVKKIQDVLNQIFVFLHNLLKWSWLEKIHFNWLKSYEKRRLKTLDALEAERNRKRLLDQQAFMVTKTIMKKVRERIGNTPLYLFNACGPLTEKEEALCRFNNFHCIPGLWDYVNSKKREGFWINVVKDRHWNRLGNEVAGRKLAAYFKENKILR